MGLQDKPGEMGRKLRALEITSEGGLRLILAALLEPTTQMTDAAWDHSEEWEGYRPLPPVELYRAMLKAALAELVDDDKQYADTDGLAKQHAALHDYLHRAGIE
jgi:hypothetical protein